MPQEIVPEFSGPEARNHRKSAESRGVKQMQDKTNVRYLLTQELTVSYQ